MSFKAALKRLVYDAHIFQYAEAHIPVSSATQLQM